MIGDIRATGSKDLLEGPKNEGHLGINMFFLRKCSHSHIDTVHIITDLNKSFRERFARTRTYH
jgi:hypothetical protein